MFKKTPLAFIFILSILLISPAYAVDCSTDLDCNDCNSWTVDSCSSGSCTQTNLIDQPPFNGDLSAYEQQTNDFLDWMQVHGYSDSVIKVYESDLKNGEVARFLAKPTFGLEPSFSIRESGRTRPNPADYQGQLLFDYKNDAVFEFNLIELKASDPNIVNKNLLQFDVDQLEQFMSEKFHRSIKINRLTEDLNYQQAFGTCSTCSIDFSENEYTVDSGRIGYPGVDGQITISGVQHYKGDGIINFLGGDQACSNNGNIYFMSGKWIEKDNKIYDLALPTSGIPGCNAVVSTDLDFDTISQEATRWTHEYAHVLGIPHMVWDLYSPYVGDPETGRLNLHKYMYGTDSIMFIPGYIGQYRSGFEMDSRGYPTMINEFDPLTLYWLEPVDGYDYTDFGREYSQNVRYDFSNIIENRQDVCGGGLNDACFNGELDPGEEEIDCGGVCPICPDCLRDNDCSDGEICQLGICFKEEVISVKLEDKLTPIEESEHPVVIDPPRFEEEQLVQEPIVGSENQPEDQPEDQSFFSSIISFFKEIGDFLSNLFS